MSTSYLLLRMEALRTLVNVQQFCMIIIITIICSWERGLVEAQQQQTNGAGTSATSQVLTYNLTEKLPAGTIVGNLAGDATSLSTTSAGRFILLNTTHANQQLFAVDSAGLLRTSSIINRDVICAKQAACNVQLDVVFQPSSQLSTNIQLIRVQVSVIDLNDNAPSFTQPGPVNYPISVTTSTGVLFPLPVATENDSPVNNLAGYRLVPTSDVFAIQSTLVSGDGVTSCRVFDVRLVLLKSLLQQQQQAGGKYSFTLTAYDGGSPSLSGSIQITIVVNPTVAQFDENVYYVTVASNALPGAPVVTLHATLPSSPRSTLSYTFSYRTKAVYGQLFAVNASTGLVTLGSGGGAALTNPTYNMSVEANDPSSPNSLPAIAALIVSVTYVNSQPPIINVDAMTASGQPEVVFLSPPGTFVAFLSVTDASPDQEVTCLLNGDINWFVLRQMFPGNYKILTTQVLYSGQYRVTVKCSDNGTPQLSSEDDLNITVVDVDYPTFAQATYNATVLVSNYSGQFAVKIIASNSSPINKGPITYSLVADDEFSDHFFIDSAGSIFTATGFGSENLNRQYLLHVTATNVYNLTSDCLVYIEAITRTQISFDNVAMSCDTSQPLCKLGFNDVAYYAVLDSFSSSIFVDSLTGNVSVSGGSDSYQLTVKMQLNTVPAQFRYAVIDIAFGEMKSSPLQSPYFMFPTPSNNFVHFAVRNDDELLAGSVVAVVSASAAGEDVALQYSITSNDSATLNYFLMSAVTGQLRFNDGIHGYDVINKTHLLYVTATATQSAKSTSPRRQTQSTTTLFVACGPPKTPLLLVTPSSGSINAILAGIIAGVVFVTILLTIFLVVACVKCRRRRRKAKASASLSSETFWSRVQADSPPNTKVMTSPAANLKKTTPAVNGYGQQSIPNYQNVNGSVDGGHPQLQMELHARDGVVVNQIIDTADGGVGGGDEDSGFAGISNSVASSHSSSASSSDERQLQFNRSSSAKISEFLLGTSSELIPMTSSTPQCSSNSLYYSQSVVPEWLTSTPEVILTPSSSSAAILRRTGSTCSRKSVRFAENGDHENQLANSSLFDPKKRVHFDIDRNQYLDPRVCRTGSDVASPAESEELGDGASEMSYTNSDCSSGLYIVNSPNHPNNFYRVGSEVSRPPIISFRTFLPPGGSLV